RACSCAVHFFVLCLLFEELDDLMEEEDGRLRRLQRSGANENEYAEYNDEEDTVEEVEDAAEDEEDTNEEEQDTVEGIVEEDAEE
ncbi:hypothetical protein scyTo_0025690, partial [Scyliorhinus torazame]|nr:hypothetical protein [Scyliorhinus torazame]